MGCIMSLACGIVGLPNVGKSTLFNALTKAGIEAANYPFCTIEPNIGLVTVPDPRLQAISAIVNPHKSVPALVEFVDIAGLVAGASQGDGLGNQFLAHIRESNAIIHVIRCFEDPNIIHVSGKVDPLDDASVIATELALADLATVEKAIEREKKKAKSGHKEAFLLLQLLESLLEPLNSAIHLRLLSWTPEQMSLLKPLCLLTLKPVLYVANVAEDGFMNNPYLEKLEELAKQQESQVIALSASMEAELVDLDEEEKKLFLADVGLKEPGLNRLIRAAYDLLGLQTYFTAGVKEVRAWTIKKGTHAPQAAGEIHSDFERGFICAQVIAYDDFIALGGELKAKEAGKVRTEGKDYVMQDGDIVEFRSGLAARGKK